MAEIRLVKVTSPEWESGGASKRRSQPWDDRGILALLSDRLRKECRLDPANCTVDVRDHVAYVHGTVETIAQKQAIHRAASSIPGLKAIVNQLRIAPLSHVRDRRAGAELQDAMRKAGLGDPLPDARVIDGVAYLSGVIGSLDSRKLAEDVCWSVPGVEYVVNDITVTDARCSKEAARGQVVKEVKQALEGCLGVTASGVTAETRGGIVRLRGEVESVHSKFLIEDTLRWIPCVVDVVNELTVRSRSSN